MSDATPLLRQPIIHINNDQALSQYCEQWSKCRLLAIDTEFMRVDTYYPIAALIQVNDGQANYLIDPLHINDWSLLANIMTNSHIIKAFHACSEDLDVFNNLLGVVPTTLFDTQIAAALLGVGSSVGYGNLVNECLGVVLPKGETRSNWLARPLSVAQLNYAALDVDYLFGLAEQLERQLQALDRESWVYEESKALVANYRSNLDPASGFYKSNNTWRLSAKNVFLAKQIFEWRENTARENNIPKSRILKDPQIFDVLNKAPNTRHELKALGLHDSAIRKFGQALIDIIHAQYPESSYAEVVACDAPLTKLERDQIKALRNAVKTIADTHNIASEVLAKKSIYQSIVRKEPKDTSPLAALQRHTSGWRASFFASINRVG